jgi:hypothetical protein
MTEGMTAHPTHCRYGHGRALAMDESQPSISRRIHRDYQRWRKAAPLLYSSVTTRALEWPSLTVQFVPGNEALQPTQPGHSHSPFHMIPCLAECEHDDHLTRIPHFLFVRYS